MIVEQFGNVQHSARTPARIPLGGPPVDVAARLSGCAPLHLASTRELSKVFGIKITGETEIPRMEFMSRAR